MTTTDPRSARIPADELAADPLGSLLRVLELETLPEDDGRADGADVHFSGGSLHQPNKRIYGGQVLAQSLLAAGRTVPDGRLPHSMHGYFLRPGDLDVPVELAVERLRDGRSFSARRTHAIQHGKPILSMIASFQESQEGVEHTTTMPAAPDPETLRSAIDELGSIPVPAARSRSHESAFDLRHVEGSLYLDAGPERTDQQMVWMRARGPVDGDQLLHRALLAFACDQIMLEPVMRRVGSSWATPGISIASLDHAMWWHRDVRVDEWLLYVQSSPSAQGGRGLGATRVFAQDGTLVASIAQEGMLRLPV
ncbi:acyl-CoA thioesterase-2 [Sediminihabitans luteus]|uniref:Acyl-CoA thioesterase 2 n=1 Tax=Sediminihabitans luteus TaxID=1138585 RepID=A0A2M9CYC5_9CELL|nr:acyl-CoA thioesterase II [Sediminihabitans luteus]PJJ76843.1 acyl-CoA thioesterase-2 [Sediminihabitans luteus]GIJ00322.1 acyl-CoA thioesterase II [Sediminihabitans luteus]